jgi:hypothetical protein
MIIQYRNNWKDDMMRMQDTQLLKILWKYQQRDRITGWPEKKWNGQF